MSQEKPVHSAAQSAAGYLYQARLALAECLRFAYGDSSIEIAIEKLDDVSFEKDGTALELLQTKHHLKKAPDGSAAVLLRPVGAGSVARNPEAAEALLMKAAAASENESLKKAVAAFSGLGSAIRRELVNAIEVLDGQPLIADLGAAIEERLRMIAPRGKTALAREQLEGWWWPRICAVLQAETPGTISVLEVEQKLDDIRDALKRDALPLDMEHVEPSPEEMGSLDEMRFVRQLRTVGVSSLRLQYAKRDFYRASVQRSRWVRQSLLFDGEVGRFEQQLIEEWQPRFAQMCDGLAADCKEAVLRAAGQQLYSWVETDARFSIRTQTVRFLTVGSYHILADDLRVGWHRDFETLHVVEPAEPADA